MSKIVVDIEMVLLLIASILAIAVIGILPFFTMVAFHYGLRKKNKNIYTENGEVFVLPTREKSGTYSDERYVSKKQEAA